MGRHTVRSWLKALQPRRRSPIRRQSPRARLSVERFEDRALPSTTIPLNSQTWTSVGPSPIAVGQAPGNPSSTGRVNGVGVDSTKVLANGSPAPEIVYAASDSGGLWRSTDGGLTWSPRTDFQQLFMQTLTVVPRGLATDTLGTQNTIYAFDQLGKLWLSVDGAETFTQSSPFPDGAAVNKVIVVPGATQAQDLLYVAVGTLYGAPPSSAPNPNNDPQRVPGSGVWRSTNGGQTWTNMVNSGVSPFTLNPGNPVLPGSLSFSDVVVNPTNPNIVYAAVGNAFGDPTNGVYRTSNALAATPTWTLLIGGSSFVPGETPGVIKLSIAPLAPSVVFASIALRLDPDSGTVPLLGVFRSTDSGSSWAPVLLPNPNNPIFDPNNFMGLFGYDNNVVAVSPTNQFGNSSNPFQQTVVLAGFGFQDNTLTSLVSTNSGATWTRAGVGANGIGTYPNVHQGVFDKFGRLIVATGGGVYRLTSISPTVRWESLNGTTGPNGLNVAQLNGIGLHPTNENQAAANAAWVGDLPNAVAPGVFANFGPTLHNALLFFDPGTGGPNPAAYGWTSVDFDPILGFDNNTGQGVVFYNPFNPNILYRTVPEDGTGNSVRRSDDGGQTWVPATNGLDLAGGIPAVAFDPSQPNRLFSGFFNVFASDDAGDNWFQAMQVGALGGFNIIPDMPTAAAGLPITAIGVGRTSGADFGGTGINGVSLFVATPDDVLRDAPEPLPSITGNNSDDDDPTNIPASAALPLQPPAPATIGPQLWVNLIPTNVTGFPGGITWDAHSWGNLTPDLVNNQTGAAGPDGFSDFTGNITQIVVDPGTNDTIYVFTSTGQVFRGTGYSFKYIQDQPGEPGGTISDDGVLIGYAPDGIELFDPFTGDPIGPSPPINAASITWTDITGNLQGTPAATFFVPVTQGLALDAQVITDLSDDILYAVSPQGGVWRLDNPSGDFSTTQPVWVQVGLDAGGNRSMPPAQVTSIALNSTTGILAAATYGRGAFELQIRGLIRGEVFKDTNGNGVLDTGENPVAGATVDLLDLDNGNAIIASTATDAQGIYQFRNLFGGNFQVVVHLPTGSTTVVTTPDLVFQNFTQSSNFDIANRTTNPAVVAQVVIGTFSPGSISGSKFQDTNGDGIRGGSEPGLGGFVIFVDGNNNGVLDTGEPSVTSAANGTWTLTNVGPTRVNGQRNTNLYFFPNAAPDDTGVQLLIREVQQAGFIQTTPLLNLAPLTSGQTITNRLIGNKPLPSLSGLAFTDRNGNGVRDAGEPVAAGFTIELDGPGGPFTTVTAANGTYKFPGLTPGDYVLSEQATPGVTVTTPNPVNVTVGPNDTLTGFNFGNFTNVTVSGTKFDDVNGNGVQDGGEAGLSGFTFDLVDVTTNTVVAQANSDGSGAFTFLDVGPRPGGGTYSVREEPQAGWVQTSPNPANFTPLSGTNVTTAAVGNFRAFGLSGLAFSDVNGNGTHDAGEPGFAGLSVSASGTDEAGNPQSAVTVTDANGLYSFANLRVGTYTVSVTTAGNQVQTTASPAPVVGSQGGSLSADFGIFLRGSISGVNYQDNNSNGIKEATEPGLGGYTMYIDQNNSGTLDAGELTAVTNVNGLYSFNNLGPAVILGSPNPRTFGGAYVIREVQRTGFQATAPAEGAAISVILNSGQASTGNNFGNLAGGTTPTGAPPTLVTANDGGGPPLVVVRDPTTNQIKLQFNAYDPGFTGGVRVAVGTFNNDNVPDVVTGAGPGGGPHIRIFDGATGAVIREFYAFAPSFGGGVYVATGDVNKDGRTDIVVGAGEGGGPHVRVFSGADGSLIREFYAYAPNFLVGVRVATGDFDKDGFADIVTGAGPGGGPHVQVFSGNGGGVLKSFYAYAPNFSGGIYVAAGDVNGDGVADIMTGPGNGGGPHLRVFNGVDGSVLSETYAFPPAGWTSGLRVASGDVNGDSRSDVVVTNGRGRSGRVRVLDGVSLADLLGTTLAVNDPSFLGGIFVGES